MKRGVDVSGAIKTSKAHMGAVLKDVFIGKVIEHTFITANKPYKIQHNLGYVPASVYGIGETGSVTYSTIEDKRNWTTETVTVRCNTENETVILTIVVE